MSNKCTWNSITLIWLHTAYLSTQIFTQQFIFHSFRNPCMLWVYWFYLILCFVYLEIYSIPQFGRSESTFIPKAQTTTYTIELLHTKTHYHGLLSRVRQNFHTHVPYTCILSFWQLPDDCLVRGMKLKVANKCF